MNKTIILKRYNDCKLENLIEIKNKQRRYVKKTNEIEFSDNDSKYIFIKTSFSFLIGAEKIVMIITISRRSTCLAKNLPYQKVLVLSSA